jgi:hypothetical protein
MLSQLRTLSMGSRLRGNDVFWSTYSQENAPAIIWQTDQLESPQ